MGGLLSKSTITNLLKQQGIDLQQMCTNVKGTIGGKVDSKINQVLPKIEAEIDPIVDNIQFQTPKYVKIGAYVAIAYLVIFLILLVMQVLAFIMVLKKTA